MLDQFPDINDTLSDFRSEVENAVADVDTNSTIEEAISAIQTLKANISSMQSNAQTYYNDIELNRFVFNINDNHKLLYLTYAKKKKKKKKKKSTVGEHY